MILCIYEYESKNVRRVKKKNRKNEENNNKNRSSSDSSNVKCSVAIHTLARAHVHAVSHSLSQTIGRANESRQSDNEPNVIEQDDNNIQNKNTFSFIWLFRCTFFVVVCTANFLKLNDIFAAHLLTTFYNDCACNSGIRWSVCGAVVVNVCVCLRKHRI